MLEGCKLRMVEVVCYLCFQMHPAIHLKRGDAVVAFERCCGVHSCVSPAGRRQRILCSDNGAVSDEC
jgi:hypothetical protein